MTRDIKLDDVNLTQKKMKEYSNNPHYKPEIPTDSEKGFPLLQLSHEYFRFDDIILDDETKKRLEYIIDENKMAENFFKIGLKPKQKILFCGPPGTGKTLSAKVVSSMVDLPFVYILFDSIVSSLLGETATNLRKIFDFIQNGKYVVLFDEFDIVGKKRNDPNEHGEIKRVVNNFMQMLDLYNGDSILIAATNHQQMLDTALWRRFDEILYFDLPDLTQRKALFVKYLHVFQKIEKQNISNLARKTKGYSGAEIAQICQDSIRKAVVENRLQITINDLNWTLLEQKRRKKLMKLSQ